MTDDRQTIIEFPCTFPIKAMGKKRDDFEKIVTELVMQHVTDEDLISVKMRPSKQNNFLSVTVTVNATSQNQLDAIYMSLTSSKHVLMAI